jgi:predicted ABC-type ATPase
MTLGAPDKDPVWRRAIEYARQHKKEIARRLTDPSVFVSEERPVSVFMAGSPGAGKTEASKALLEKFAPQPILRIDPDELRSEFPEYDGANAWLFQGAISILVDRILDLVFRQSQSFILDGTLAVESAAQRNIERSLRRDRFVQILYVYQNPRSAWKFVCAREEVEGRKILPEHFVEQYFAARKVVNGLKDLFGRNLRVDLLVKNIDGSDKFYKANIDRIDFYVPEKYDPETLLAEIRGLRPC